MFDKNQIIESSKLLGLRPYQQERHYVQTAILVVLSDFPLVFKGGTYLWFFHGLDRYSTDLDFTINNSDFNKNMPDFINELLDIIKKKLWVLEGIEAECKLNNFKEGVGFSIKVKAKGPLYKNKFSFCYIDIDISYREIVLLKTKPYKLNIPYYNFPQKIITGMNLNEILAEKIRAIITRAIITRDSVRDIYDLWFLLNIKQIPFTKDIIKIIESKLDYYGFIFDQKKLKNKISEMKNEFKELNNFVFSKLESFDFYKKQIFEKLNYK
jgi:predicted nucleotidyltransferase component of viral defense system